MEDRIFNKKFKFNKEQLERSNIILSDRQKDLYRGIRDNILTVIQGPSGTSKTFTACYTALSLLADGKVNRIILTKPLQTSGEEVGFLKGTLEEKVLPYFLSYFSNFEKIIGKAQLDWMLSTGEIKVETLAYMRGATYDNAVMIIDEAQNCTMHQLMLWVTRLGSNDMGKYTDRHGNTFGSSKAIMMGDISQYDIKKKDSRFLEFIDLVKDIDGTHNFKFTTKDIVRNRFLIDVVDRYEEWKSNNE